MKPIMVERKAIPSQEIYTSYLLTPLIQKAVIVDAQQFRAGSSRRDETRNNILQSVWGSANENTVKISPSTAANCLRWIGYKALGYTGSPQPFEAELGLMIASAAHYSLLRKLKDFGLSEQSLIDEEHGISGRLDFLIKNPKTSEWQIADFKFVSDYGFRQVKREGIAKSLKNTKGIYNPSPEARLQIIMYMWMQRNEGFNVSMGNVVYINKNSGKIKEALVPWDALAEYDIKDFLEKIRVASDQIKKGELPVPTVASEHICASFCPYRIYCEYGQEFAAGRVRRESNRRPNWVYVKAREEATKAREKMEKLGLVQPQLFTIDSTGKIQT